MLRHIFLFILMCLSIYSNVNGSEKEVFSPADIIQKISDSKLQSSFKFNLLRYMRENRLKFDSREKEIVHSFLNGVLIKSNESEKNKLLAVKYYSYFKLIPDKSIELLKDNLLFYNNSAKVIKQFFISTAYLGNWFDYEYYNQLIKLLKTNSKKLDMKKRFLLLWLLHSEPKDAQGKVDLGKMSIDDYFIYKGDLIYYNTVKNDSEMLLYINSYPEYSEWKNFCYSMVIDKYISIDEWRELVQRRFKLVISSNNANIIKTYLKFQVLNPDYELPYITKKQIEQLNNVVRKYPELKEFILK